jgi:hypothetical protein
LGEQSDPRASAAEILAGIIEEVEEQTSDFNQDTDIMVENLETGEWTIARGAQALESAQEDVKRMQQTFAEKYAVPPRSKMERHGTEIQNEIGSKETSRRHVQGLKDNREPRTVFTAIRCHNESVMVAQAPFGDHRNDILIPQHRLNTSIGPLLHPPIRLGFGLGLKGRIGRYAYHASLVHKVLLSLGPVKTGLAQAFDNTVTYKIYQSLCVLQLPPRHFLMVVRVTTSEQDQNDHSLGRGS